MGLEKLAEYDHSQDSVFKAVGYSERTLTNELEPRAALLANQIVAIAKGCATMAIEVLMDSPVLRDSALDNRDRAFIILMAAPVIAATFVQAAAEDQGKSERVCESNHGFIHNSALEQYEVLKIEKHKWDMLTGYATKKVCASAGRGKVSRLVEYMQEILDDTSLNPLQKAVVESLVARESATETAKRISATSGVIGPLATIGRS